jgi:hypothetical protein
MMSTDREIGSTHQNFLQEKAVEATKNWEYKYRYCYVSYCCCISLLLGFFLFAWWSPLLFLFLRNFVLAARFARNGVLPFAVPWITWPSQCMECSFSNTLLHKCPQ